MLAPQKKKNAESERSSADGPKTRKNELMGPRRNKLLLVQTSGEIVKLNKK